MILNTNLIVIYQLSHSTFLMEIKDAIQLIRFQALQDQANIWVDLGCGTGTFTRALVHLLPEQSLIHAFDKDKKALLQVPDSTANVKIEKHHANFMTELLPLELDGVLMANSLHYVKEKEQFINKLLLSLKENGQLLIVEYDTKRSNLWVPYPIPFEKLSDFLIQLGFKNIEKLGERRSVYSRSNMYAAIANL